MKKLYWVGKHLELRTIIPVLKLDNDQDWEFVMAKGRWHSHDFGKSICVNDECDPIVMAVF
jgi:hypothetical protein